jgi:hypothetical protein
LPRTSRRAGRRRRPPRRQGSTAFTASPTLRHGTVLCAERGARRIIRIGSWAPDAGS